MKPSITNRSTGNGDCYLVTGSIGPKYQPKLFRTVQDAKRYARSIVQDGLACDVFPPYRVVIEDRHASNMLRMVVL